MHRRTSAIFDVRVEPILIVTCNVCACGAFSDLQSATSISHISLAIMKDMTMKIYLFISGVSYNSVAQKWRIFFSIFWELLRSYWGLKQYLKAETLN